MAVVYWIHTSKHSDITKEGYVGMTTQHPLERYSEHLNLAGKSDNTLYKALEKYKGQTIFTVLLEGSAEYCLEVEYKLRPTMRIGWNIAIGGGKPPIFTGHSEESKRKIGLGAKATSQSAAHLASRASRVGVKRPKYIIDAMLAGNDYSKPWQCPRANKSVWVMADKLFEARESTLVKGIKPGAKRLEKLFGLTRGSLESMCRYFSKHDWNPNNDDKWVFWSSQQIK